MRYHLIPRDVEDAATTRRDMALRARDRAQAALARADRARARVRRFWLGVGALYALAFAYVVFYTWSV